MIKEREQFHNLLSLFFYCFPCVFIILPALLKNNVFSASIKRKVFQNWIVPFNANISTCNIIYKNVLQEQLTPTAVEISTGMIRLQLGLLLLHICILKTQQYAKLCNKIHSTCGKMESGCSTQNSISDILRKQS